MKREFVVNIVLLFIINLIVKPAYIFGIEARVQDLVGTESYGLYFSLFNFVFLFQFINDPGLQTWNSQFVSKNRDIIGQHFSDLLLTKLILSSLFFAATLFIAYILGFGELKLLGFIAINLILSSAFMLLRSSIAGLGFYKVDSLLSAFDKILMIFFIGYLVWFSHHKEAFTIKDFVLAQMLALFISTLVGSTILYFKTPTFVFDWKIQSFLRILKSTMPYVMTMIFMTAYNKLDGVMLGQLIDDNNYQAGVYASAYRFYDAANMMGYLFAALLLPMFASNMYNINILKELQSIGLRYSTTLAIIIVLFLWFNGEIILSFLYSEYQVEFFDTLRWLIIGYLAMAMGYIYGTLLVATGHVKHVNVVYGFGLIFNVIFNIIMIPVMGAKGAALATVITQIIVLLGQVYIVKRELAIVPLKKDLFKLFLFFIMGYAVFESINVLFPTQWNLRLIINGIICLLLPFILRIIQIQEVKLLMSKGT